MFSSVFIFAEVTIVRGPTNTTACMHQNASFFCGFTGVNPLYLVLNWSIIWRDESGSVTYARNYSVFTINRDTNNGLEWIPDLNNSTNSKLVINSVNEIYNWSSFQCIVPSVDGNHIASTTGFLEVAGKSSFIKIFVYLYIYVRIYTHTYVYTYIYVHTYVDMYIYVCTYVCTYVHINIHILLCTT